MNEYNVGDVVIATCQKLHEIQPGVYPCAGTIGIVIKARSHDCLVQWPDGATIGAGQWDMGHGCITHIQQKGRE